MEHLIFLSVLVCKFVLCYFVLPFYFILLFL